MINSLAKIITALSITGLVAFGSFCYGMNVGSLSIANTIGPAFLQCVNLIGKR